MNKESTQTVPRLADFDFSDFAEPQEVADNVLAKLAVAASEGVRLEAELQALGEEVKQVQDQLKAILDTQIPELMKEANQKDVVTGAGIRIKLKEGVTGNCPAASTIAKEKDPEKRKELMKRQYRLFQWLDQNGYGKLINRELTVTFDRAQEELSKQVEAELRAKGDKFAVSRHYTVHPMTLNSFIKTALDEGVDVPSDVFGIHEYCVAKLEIPKEKKTSR